MPDFGIISKSLKVMSIKRLNESAAAASWCQILADLMEYLKPVGGRFLFQCNFDLNYLPIDLSSGAFYEEALKAWQEINCRNPDSVEQILNEIIWNNRFIRIDFHTSLCFYLREQQEMLETRALYSRYTNYSYLPPIYWSIE